MSVSFSPKISFDPNADPNDLAWSISVIARNITDEDLFISGLTKEDLKRIYELELNPDTALKDDFTWNEIKHLVKEFKFSNLIKDNSHYKLWSAIADAGQNNWGPILSAYGSDPKLLGKEMTLSNNNASELLRLLNLNESDCVSPMVILKNIENVKKYNGQIMITEEPAVHHDPGHSTIYTPGRNFEYVNHRLNQLEEIADFCIKHELDLCWG